MAKKKVEFKPQVEMRSPKALKPYMKNAKLHSDDQVDRIAHQISTFGFYAPIVVDKDDVVIAGHGRLMAANRLGLKEVPVIAAVHLSEPEVQAARIADNKVVGDDFDEDLLSFELGSLERAGFDLTLTGMDFEDITSLLPEDELEVGGVIGQMRHEAAEKPAAEPVKNVTDEVLAQAQEISSKVMDGLEEVGVFGGAIPSSADPSDPSTWKGNGELRDASSANPSPFESGPVAGKGDVWIVGGNELKVLAPVNADLLMNAWVKGGGAIPSIRVSGSDKPAGARARSEAMSLKAIGVRTSEKRKKPKASPPGKKAAKKKSPSRTSKTKPRKKKR